MEVVLIIRTWAVWGRDKRIGLGLFAAFLALWITNSYFLNSFVKSMECTSYSSIDLLASVAYKCYGSHACANDCAAVERAGENILFVDYILNMVFETSEYLYLVAGGIASHIPGLVVLGLTLVKIVVVSSRQGMSMVAH